MSFAHQKDFAFSLIVSFDWKTMVRFSVRMTIVTKTIWYFKVYYAYMRDDQAQ